MGILVVASRSVGRTPLAQFAASLLVASALATPALADTSTEGLEEVVVTARKVSEPLQSVPLAITAISGDALSSGNHLRIEDLGQFSPSLNVLIPSPHQTLFSVRGLGANPGNDGLESSAGVFLDGVYLGRPGMASYDLIDIDQIEVVRGPQGTLYGKNTTAGAININTALPKFTTEALFQASGGDMGYYQLQGSVTGPLVDDQLAARLTGYRTSRAGWVTDVTTGAHLNGINRYGGRGQLLFKPNEALTLRLIAEYGYEDDSNGATLLANYGATPTAFQTKLAVIGATAIADPNGRQTADNDPTKIQERQSALTLLADYTLSGFTLTSITGYRNYYYYSVSDVDTTNHSVLNAGYGVHDNQLSQELRVSTSKDDAYEAVAGLYYFQQNVNMDQFVSYGPDAAAWLSGVPNSMLPTYAKYSPTLAALLSYNNSRWDIFANPGTRSYAGFGQVVWHLLPDLNITAGFRETYENKMEYVFRPNPISTTTGTASAALAYNVYPSTKVGTKNWAPSGLFSVDYRIAPDVMVYVTASEGEKAGGVNATVPATGYTADSLVVKPETAYAVETGVKSQFFDRRLTFNADLFYTIVTDYQATYITTAPGTTTSVQLLTNVGRVRSDGFEAEASAVPVTGLNLSANLSYTDAIYDSYTNGPCAAEVTGKTVCDLTGRPVSDAPKWNVNLRGSFERPVVDGVAGFVAVEYSYKSSYYGYLDDSAYSKAGNYTLVNARLGVHLAAPNVELYGWVKNAANERYITGSLNYGSLLPGIYVPFFGEPRTVGITLRAAY